jgi:hypothetical protein
MKIHKLQIYQEFDAPIDEVWEAFNDHANFGRIMGSQITRIRDSSDPGNINGTGSVRNLKLPTGNCEETITESEKPGLIEYKITKGTPLHHHYGIMKFDSLSDRRSALTYSIELGSRYPLIGGIVKSALEKGISAGLKKYAKKLQR